MAKKKKASGKPAVGRRAPRRSNQPSETGEGSCAQPAPPETPAPPAPAPDTPAAPVTPAAPATEAPQPEPTLPAGQPATVKAPHKKFGKYRCLFNSDDSHKKYDGSDSETNSSVEIRVIDPCASSESDSNAALDTHSDTASVTCHSPSTLTSFQSYSRDISPVPLTRELQLSQLSVNTEVDMGTNMIPQLYTPIVTVVTQDQIALPPTYNEIALPPSNEEIALPPSNEEIALPPLNKEIGLPSSNQEMALPPPPHIEEEHKSEEPSNIPLLEQEGDEEYCDDDEVITVVQIVEDDNPEYYYDLQLSSPKDSAVNEETNVRDDKEQISHFQQHFEKLNLVNTNAESISPMDCSDMNDSKDRTSTYTPELLSKENASDSLLRPDPSLTPSSTLSDDSNSSRVTSEQAPNNSNDSAESSPTGVRRSSRIKTISTLKQKTKGYGLVKTPLKKALMSSTKLKLEELGSDSQEKMPELMSQSNSASPTFPVPSDMPVKVKSRWRRSSELEMGGHSPAVSPLASPSLPNRLPPVSEAPSLSEEDQKASKEQCEKIIKERMSQYQHLDENEYLCERMISKETKKMICDCFLTKEEIERGELGCGEDCLNRLLMIECNYRCPVGDRCTNRRFQKMETAQLRVFYADKKGCGVEASVDIPAGEFLMEYVGEVLDYEQFYKRAQAYSDENNLHHYFMSLKGDTVIDATLKGNVSRFINHSCDPIAETQKWTVNGELRIGFFSKRDIKAGEELTFDYQFQRFGKEAQRCYCGADNCRRWIGAEPDSDEEYEEEDDDVSTSKSESVAPDVSPADSAAAPRAPPLPRPRRPRRARPAFAVPAPDRVQDADIEEDIESLSRTGIKNQSHTLRLSRTVVRAKTRRAQAALLRLLRGADLPCRRLFLDYRGLRLLAPWCADADATFKLEMLQTVDRLPVPNKSMAQESRFLTILERWLSAADAPDQLFIDEATGLPVENPTGSAQEASDKAKENAAVAEKVRELAKQMLERWSSLKEVFKIPKKERIQQMKEHERQANVERRAADSSGARERGGERGDERRERERERDRDRDKYRERERDRERERERDRDRERERDDRDRRKRRSSPDGRRSIRLSERVLAAVPPMSKEERRRAFAEAADAAEQARRRPPEPNCWPPYAPYAQPQMFPPGMMGGPPNMLGGPPNMLGGPPNMLGGPPNMIGGPPNMLGGPPNMMGGPAGMMGGPPNMLGGPPMGPEWMPGEFPQQHPAYQPYPYCVPQANFMGMGGMPGFGLGGFMFPPAAAYPAPAPAAPAPAPPPPSHESEAVLPALWRSAEDARGRTYYYHVKLRQPQWQPPDPPPNNEESSSEEEEVAQPMDTSLVRRKGKVVEGVNGIYEVIKEDAHSGLIPEHALLTVKPRKRRPGLVTERPISPRTEEDKQAGRLEVKRYKETKEKLRKRRERLLQRARTSTRRSGRRSGRRAEAEHKLTELVDTDSDSESDCEEVEEAPAVEVPEPAAPAPPAPAPPAPPAQPAPPEEEAISEVDQEELSRKIKETFRSSMARVMVHHLNPYRHRGAALGRITNTSDFKHLARKLTHFVMLKELKHCRSVDELVVTDSVRSKAKEFVKKYMAKFGPVYKRPAEEVDA